jgi:hypothetical protein
VQRADRLVGGRPQPGTDTSVGAIVDTTAGSSLASSAMSTVSVRMCDEFAVEAGDGASGVGDAGGDLVQHTGAVIHNHRALGSQP